MKRRLPPLPLCRPVALIGLALLTFSGPVLRAGKAPSVEVNVIVDMTAEGRKVTRPDPEHPAYYFPYVAGYTEEGTQYAGEPPRPPQKTVVHQIAKTLADQGYLVTDKAHPASILLVLHWGAMNPMMFAAPNDDPDDITGFTNFNQRRMLALVAGKTQMNVNWDSERTDILQKTEEDRYFIALSAYDLAVYMKSHKKVLLWQAKVSVESTGLSLAGVMQTMLDSAGPQLGFETYHPKIVVKDLPPGTVTSGTPVEVPLDGKH